MVFLFCFVWRFFILFDLQVPSIYLQSTNPHLHMSQLSCQCAVAVAVPCITRKMQIGKVLCLIPNSLAKINRTSVQVRTMRSSPFEEALQYGGKSTLPVATERETGAVRGGPSCKRDAALGAWRKAGKFQCFTDGSFKLLPETLGTGARSTQQAT